MKYSGSASAAFRTEGRAWWQALPSGHGGVLGGKRRLLERGGHCQKDADACENANRKKYFIPEMSAANTNLIRKYPEFAEDVEKIKAELSEYIFDFDQYDAIDSSNQSFFGRSLNRKKK